MRRIIGLVAVIILAGLASACATGVKGSARNICYEAGYQPGTQQFSNCWKSVRNEQFAREWPAMNVGVAAGITAGNSVKSRGVYSGTPGTFTPRVWHRDTRHSAVPSTWLCPNGSYVFGTGCFLAPNGTYYGSWPQLAPNRTYVGGSPRLAPNGKYVGGTGPIVLCPDGSYVTGRNCQLMPNGTYLGVP